MASHPSPARVVLASALRGQRVCGLFLSAGGGERERALNRRRGAGKARTCSDRLSCGFRAHQAVGATSPDYTRSKL